jgi:hypothetical protein
MKEYIDDNEDKIKEYKEDNREKIREYFKEKVTCKCGFEVNKYSLKRHERTKKHINLINNDTFIKNNILLSIKCYPITI